MGGAFARNLKALATGHAHDTAAVCGCPSFPTLSP
jgi:hypothetical protein